MWKHACGTFLLAVSHFVWNNVEHAIFSSLGIGCFVYILAAGEVSLLLLGEY